MPSSDQLGIQSNLTFTYGLQYDSTLFILLTLLKVWAKKKCQLIWLINGLVMAFNPIDLFNPMKSGGRQEIYRHK